MIFLCEKKKIYKRMLEEKHCFLQVNIIFLARRLYRGFDNIIIHNKSKMFGTILTALNARIYFP